MATQDTTLKLKLDDALAAKQLSVTSVVSGGNTTQATGKDSDKNRSKHAVVHKLVVNGQEVDILIRVELLPNRGIFVDVVADSSIANLSTTVAAMAITTVGHPATAKDHVDKEALIAAGGS